MIFGVWRFTFHRARNRCENDAWKGRTLGRRGWLDRLSAAGEISDGVASEKIDWISILLERAFSLQILAKPIHQIGTECPTFGLLRVRIGKMFPNFLQAFLRLLITFQPLGLL